MNDKPIREVLELIEEITFGIQNQGLYGARGKLLEIFDAAPRIHPDEPQPNYRDIKRWLGPFVQILKDEAKKRYNRDYADLSDDQLKELLSIMEGSFPRQVFYFRWLYRQLLLRTKR
ncbi:MAG TPA: hypothetical protein ENG51_23460 [Deltaproteobacteria bacterium]|nr:hypothetical protein [Deltaproteobacteria bacterium]